jgi:hypothetical protein
LTSPSSMEAVAAQELVLLLAVKAVGQTQA